MGIVSKKPIKINGFQVKPDPNQKTHLPNNVNIFYLYFHSVEESFFFFKRLKCVEESYISKTSTLYPIY